MFIPKADMRWATRTPIRPRPTTPRVFSLSSTPVYLLRFHSPFFSAELAGAMLRAVAISRPQASSAAVTMLEVGALTTITPALVAAATSTLSRPTPARATTRSFPAAATASASTLVALRIRMASTSVIADSSSARSAPLQCRISKSGPSASTVAGDSSSAMSTTGFWLTWSSLVLRGRPVPRSLQGGRGWLAAWKTHDAVSLTRFAVAVYRRADPGPSPKWKDHPDGVRRFVQSPWRGPARNDAPGVTGSRLFVDPAHEL